MLSAIGAAGVVGRRLGGGESRRCAGRKGVQVQTADFERSQRARGRTGSNGRAALRACGLELCTKSSIARVARAALLVNRRNITFDALVVREDTGRAHPAPAGKTVQARRPDSRAGRSLDPVHCWNLKRPSTQEPF